MWSIIFGNLGTF